MKMKLIKIKFNLSSRVFSLISSLTDAWMEGNKSFN